MLTASLLFASNLLISVDTYIPDEIVEIRDFNRIKFAEDIEGKRIRVKANPRYVANYVNTQEDDDPGPKETLGYLGISFTMTQATKEPPDVLNCLLEDGSTKTHQRVKSLKPKDVLVVEGVFVSEKNSDRAAVMTDCRIIEVVKAKR